jgi:signal transduction histidine kinase/CheY-like chemotaxis protein/HPt (histidine-containing phosphotransfer) domain-containing protein
MFNSLQKQILVVLIGLVLMLVVQVFLSQTNQTQLATNLKTTSELAAEIALVLEIERDLIDLQRNVFIYKSNANESSISHFKTLLAGIYKKLSEFETHELTQSDYQKITSMRGHLKDYESNFNSVIDGRTQRNTLFQQKIERDLKQINTLIDQKDAGNLARQKLLSDIRNHLTTAESLSYQYLIEPDYELIEQFNQQLRSVSSKANRGNLQVEQINSLVAQISTDFNRLTQVTRGYVFLVNVVMAGSANEFLYLTKEITREVTHRQQQAEIAMATEVRESKFRSDMIASFSIILALLAAAFMIGRIIIPIRKITTVFNQLSSGEDIADIPGSHRNDEVGNLAQAASVFSEKNKQTSDLLERTQKMNLSLERLTAQAQQASLAKGEFLASMSHEIRTPINGVMGMLGLLYRSGLNKKQHHYATLAKHSADSLLVVINDILDYSKIEAGKLDIEILDFNLTALFSEFVETYAILTEEKNLELVLDLTQINKPMVKGDPGRIRQILNNLLGNAIKFTSEGEITIRANLTETENHIELSVKVIDTGIGIADDKLDSLFESFTQADSSTTRKYGGTGLGLAISKRLCELMNGQITATSVLGEGSCFCFSVKLERSGEAMASIPNIDLHDLNILIVDDSETNRHVLSAQLELWGANVTSANNGKVAIKILDHQEIDFAAAFIDMSMPIMNGYELGQLIRSDHRFDSIHLIMMTSVSERGDAQRFADIGYNAYFPKPTTITDLRDALMVITEGGEAMANASPLVNRHYLKELKKANQNTARILLVDDNRINLEVANSLLEEIGLSADMVGDGAEAIVSLTRSPKDSPYQFVFMDCQMPVMDGYEATKRIRAGECGENYINIPIVAMTANAMKGDKERCLACGMNDYLSKPVELEALIEMLRQWLPNSIGTSIKVDTLELDLRPADTKANRDSGTAIWDRQRALKRMRGNKKRLLAVVEIFQQSTQDLITTIDTTADTRKFDELAAACHGLKGAAANINAEKLSEISVLLEQAAKESDNELIEKLTPELMQNYQQLINTIDLAVTESRSPR